MTAVQHMVDYLLHHHKPWTPDRQIANGPTFKIAPVTPQPLPHPQPRDAIKGRILTQLQKGPATGAEVADAIHCAYHSVNAKLSRMYIDGHVRRTKNSISAQTGRTVFVYSLKELRG